MPAFDVHHYTRSTCLQRLAGGRVTPTDLLDIVGPVEDGNVQHRALVTFSDVERPGGDAADHGDTCGYLSAGAVTGWTLVGWLPRSELADVLDALASGRAVIHFAVADGAESGGLVELWVEPGSVEPASRSNVVRSVVSAAGGAFRWPLIGRRSAVDPSASSAERDRPRCQVAPTELVGVDASPDR